MVLKTFVSGFDLLMASHTVVTVWSSLILYVFTCVFVWFCILMVVGISVPANRPLQGTLLTRVLLSYTIC